MMRTTTAQEKSNIGEIMKSVESHPNQGMHVDLSQSLKRGANLKSLHNKKERELHKRLIGEDRSDDVEDKQSKLGHPRDIKGMQKKASVQEYLDSVQMKREDTDAYLRYLTRWHDHHDNQYNPSFGIKFANTRPDADLNIGIEKVAILGGIARMAGRGVALGNKGIAGASNFAGNQARRLSALRQAGAQRSAAMKRNIVENYNMGRHGSRYGNAASFEAATLKNNPRFASAATPRATIPSAAPKTIPSAAPKTVTPTPTPSASTGSQGPALKRAVEAANPYVDKAKSAIGANVDYAKSMYRNASPNVQRGAKIGAGVIGAYGAYKAGRAAYNRFDRANNQGY